MVEHEIGETEARDAHFALERQASNERLGTRGMRTVEGVSLKDPNLYNVPQVLKCTAELISDRMSQTNPRNHGVDRTRTFPHATDAESE